MTMNGIDIDEIALADRPDAWAAYGFAVSGDACDVGAVRLRFAGGRAGGASTVAARAGDHTPLGILEWSLRGVASAALSPRDGLEGLPTRVSHAPHREPAPAHPNGVVAIDHVVAMTPDLDRTVAVLQAAGLDLRRVREQPTPAGAPRQAFFRLGAEILELVQEPGEVLARAAGRDPVGAAERPARFWGLAFLVDDIERTAARFAPHIGEVRAAVQAGRRIATVRRSAGLCLPVALISAKQQHDADADAHADAAADAGQQERVGGGEAAR
jgi:catechol 2,3-dioxygenase-like lactoylglutathione lyase family enzyme